MLVIRLLRIRSDPRDDTRNFEISKIRITGVGLRKCAAIVDEQQRIVLFNPATERLLFVTLFGLRVSAGSPAL
jgi:hypothetical protein